MTVHGSIKGLPCHHLIKVFCWMILEDECKVRYIARHHCIGWQMVSEHLETMARRGGQNKKTVKKRGHSLGFSLADTIAHIVQLIQTRASFVVSSDEVVYTFNGTAPFECALCSCVVNQPVELQCSSLVCAACCCKCVEMSGQVCKLTSKT